MRPNAKTHTRKTRRLLLSIGSIVVLFAFFAGMNVWNAYRNAATFPQFWKVKANEPIPANAIRVVALGDSATQAIGADQPMDGFVGRIASYIQAKTDRPVHITNVSAGGATYTDVMQKQLPQVDLKTADLVIVESSNDVEDQVSLDTFRAALDALMQLLPASKTIISDLPLEPGRDAYQTILQERADASHLMRADFAHIFTNEGRRLDIFSWLFPHLNTKGYAYWFLAFQPEVDTILQR